MFITKEDKVYYIEVESVLLWTTALVSIFAGLWDGIGNVMLGVLLIILDTLKYPGPNITDVTDEVDFDDGDDGGLPS